MNGESAGNKGNTERLQQVHMEGDTVDGGPDPHRDCIRVMLPTGNEVFLVRHSLHHDS